MLLAQQTHVVRTGHQEIYFYKFTPLPSNTKKIFQFICKKSWLQIYDSVTIRISLSKGLWKEVQLSSPDNFLQDSSHDAIVCNPENNFKLQFWTIVNRTVDLFVIPL